MVSNGYQMRRGDDSMSLFENTPKPVGYPRIIWKPVTSASGLFYVSCASLCLMPLVLELWTEYQFQKARRIL